MKKLIALIISVSFAFALSAQKGKGIEFFHGTWQEALAKAKKENKLIFMDAFTTWCGPCKYLSKNVFPNDTVGQFFNSNFVCVKMDMEKGEGIGLAGKYGVQAYPTLLYIDGNGEIVHRTCGADMSGKAAEVLISAGKDALDPQKQFIAFKKKYESSKPNGDLAYTYFKMRQEGCMDNSKEVTDYLQNVPESEIASRGNWSIIRDFLEEADSRAFRLMLNNKETFYSSYTKDSVNEKILDVYRASLMSAVKKNDPAKYNSLKEELELAKIPGSKRVTLATDMRMYDKQGDKEKYAAAAILYVNGYVKDDSHELNSIAWRFYEKVDDKKYLEQAEQWSKRAVELDNSYANNDTYAALLYKLGKKDEAMKAAEKAIGIAKKENEDYKETEELLKKIKAMK
jgi:uncharacterized protein YyaL (SSP411 family)